jgi:hypothetical protein
MFRRDLLLENFKSDFFKTHPTFRQDASSTTTSTDSSTSTSPTGIPDILVVQVGHHLCTLAHLKAYRDADRWTQLAEQHFTLLVKSLQSLREQWKPFGSRIIISLPSRVFYNATTINTREYPDEEMKEQHDNINYCHWRLNGLYTYIAHQHGFLVLTREEIEHRLVFKTEHSYAVVDPQAVRTNAHIAVENVRKMTRPRLQEMMEFPGAPIIAASLVEMLHCLDRNQTFVL